MEGNTSAARRRSSLLGILAITTCLTGLAGSGSLSARNLQPKTEAQPSLEEATDVKTPAVEWLLEMDQTGAAGWSIVDDRVMGGLSQGQWAVEQGVAVFSGRMTTENNGGFSSVRSGDREWGFDDATGIVVRVRGDGQTYKLGLRADGNFDGVTYQSDFVAHEEWTDVRINWSEMVPRWRGRLVESAGPLDPARVRSVGILISDSQEGPFQLELARIGMW